MPRIGSGVRASKPMSTFATTSQSPVRSAPALAELEISVAVTSDLFAIEQTWRDLEARAVLSPYQRFDWIKAYLDAGFETDPRCAYAVLSFKSLPVALLPLTIKSRFGIKIAQVI